MSKTQQQKEDQGYTKVLPMCGNCKHYTSEMVDIPGWSMKEEVKLRCGIGGFAVQKTATCARHEFKTEKS